MDTFHVWLSPLGATCKVWVEGMDNANWLLGRLRQDFAFDNSEPVSDEGSSTRYLFCMTYGTQRCYRTLDRLLNAISEVEWARESSPENTLTKPQKAKVHSAALVEKTYQPSRFATVSAFPRSVLARVSGVVATILRSGP